MEGYESSEGEGIEGREDKGKKIGKKQRREKGKLRMEELFLLVPCMFTTQRARLNKRMEKENCDGKYEEKKRSKTVD